MVKEKPASMVDTIKDKIHFEDITSYFNYQNIIQLAIYVISGFGIGFLLKKFGRHFVFTLVVGGLVLYVMQYFNIISLDIVRLKELFGIAQNATLGTVLENIIEWVKGHIGLSIGSVIGFIIGYKIG